MLSDVKLLAAVPGYADLGPQLRFDMAQRAVAFIEQQTKRYFGAPEPITEYLKGSGTYALVLRDTAVFTDSDTVVDVAERCRAGATEADLSPSQFEARESENTTVLVRLDGHRWRREWEYAVSYTRGFAIDHGPKDIEQLIIDLLTMRLNLTGKEGLSGETISGYSWTRPAIYAFEDGDIKAIPGAARTIAAWKRVVMA